MALSTLQVVENALKEIFKDPIIKQLDEGSGPIMAALEKSAENVDGGKITFSLEYGRSGGVGARKEDGVLPTPSPRKYEKASVDTKNFYARMSISDKLIKVSKSNKAAFANQFTQQMNNLLIDANDMLRRNMVGDTRGIMGTVAAGATGTTITIDGSVEAFYPGQYVDCGTVTGNTMNVSWTDYVLDVDYDANTITFEDSKTVPANGVFTINGNFGNEMHGIEDIMSADVLYGVDRRIKSWFKPTLIDQGNGGALTAFDSMNLQKVIDRIEKRTGELPNFLAGDDAMRRAYIDEQNTYKRNIDMMKVDGGYELISYNGTPFTVEKYMKPNTIDLLNTKHIQLARIEPWSWMDDDGAILHRIEDKAAYEASMVMYGDIICMKPSTNGRLTGIQGM